METGILEERLDLIPEEISHGVQFIDALARISIAHIDFESHVHSPMDRIVVRVRLAKDGKGAAGQRARAHAGRVCKNCHGIHGADQPKLVQSQSPDFGKWQIPVYFKKSDTGGACAAGCHRPKAYDRVKVFRNL